MRSAIYFTASCFALALMFASIATTCSAQAPVSGEDLELGPKKTALMRLRDKLQKASMLLAEKRTDADVRDLQQEIDADLEALLKQSRGSAGKSGGVGSKSTTQSENASETSEVSEPGKTNAPGTPNSQSSKTTGSESPTRNPLKSLIRDTWGHLPPRAREELQSVSGEDFLPKYHRMIERYYRRLADEAARQK